MVEEQKMEQRAQAVKRLRSLFDMHNLSFGAPENLGGLLVSLHENRHFSMDFWSLVNALSEDGSGTMSNEELLEATVEGATGVASSTLPEYERPGAHELRQMLAGVDTASPVTLPAPISQPSDALLPKQTFSTASAISSGSLSAEDALRTKRSIGEALTKLEQSTRELREQLAQIDAQMSDSANTQTSAPAAETPDSPTNSVETPPAPTEPKPAETSLPQPEPVIEQQAETLAKWNRIDSSESVKPAEASAPVIPAAPEPPVSVTPEPLPTPTPTPAPTPSDSEREIFARRPVHTFSQRGLAIPDPDDEPSIVAPLSSYAPEEESSSFGRWIVAVVVIAALAAGGYFGARTEAGHAMLSRAITSIHDEYESLTGQASTQQPSAPTSPEPQTSQPAQADSTAAEATPATTEAPANPSPTSAGTTSLPPTPTTSNSASEAPAAVPPAAVTGPATTKPVHKTEPTETAPVRPRATGPIPDAGAVHVPGTAMASNLIVSRVPAYPEAAKEQEIEGSVVMDVLISPTGSVTYVRTIDGDRHLRTAAEDAVMRWRYKPYLVNGVPVQVSTTVRVDFRLPR